MRSKHNSAIKKFSFILLVAIFAFTAVFCTPIQAYAKTGSGFHLYSRQAVASANGKNYGYVPSRISIKRTSKTYSLTAWDDSLPAAYNSDVSNIKYQTSIKDQGSTGGCWAFSTLASLESYLKKSTGAENNFSELNMMQNHGFDWNIDDGGNRDMAVAYLARWFGPVNENDDNNFEEPYTSKGYLPSAIRFHVQDAIYLPDEDVKSSRIAAIKRAVREYGAVTTSMYMDDDTSNNYYNGSTKAYYCNDNNSGDGYDTNHMVTVVGWNDNYSKNNFTFAPSINGAFIVKNSWNTSWGNHGYFYVSYDDLYFGSECVAFTGIESQYNYDHVYQYDDMGWDDSYGDETETQWFANIFPAPDTDQKLAAVSFYTTTPGTSYQVYYYNDASNGLEDASKTLLTSGSFSYAGYHTVKLNSAIELPNTNSYAIAVKATNPDGYSYSKAPVAVEAAVPGYSSSVTASSGQSYVSDDGTTWYDSTTLYADTSDVNVCLKAFTTEAYRPTSVSLNKTSVSLYTGNTASLGASVDPSTVQNKSVSWSSSKPGVAAVNQSGLVTAVSPGTAMISVKTNIAGKTASCAVTVGSKVAGIRLSQSYCQMNKGRAFTLAASVLPATALNKSVSWTSGNSSIATVNASGKVTAVKPGTVKIFARTSEGGYSGVCTIAVVPATQVLQPTATSIGKTSVRLDWQKPNVSGSVRYCIYSAAKSGGAYTKIAETTSLYKVIKSLKSQKNLLL